MTFLSTQLLLLAENAGATKSLGEVQTFYIRSYRKCLVNCRVDTLALFHIIFHTVRQTGECRNTIQAKTSLEQNFSQNQKKGKYKVI